MPAQPAGMGRPPSHRKPKTSPKHSGRRTLHSKFARSSHHHQSQASHESHPNPPLVLSPGSLLSRCRTNTLESCWNCPLEGQGPRRATALPHAGSAGLYQPVALWWSWRHCTALSMACLVRSVTPISNPPQNASTPSWAPALVSGVRPTLSARREAGPAYQGVKDKRVIDICVRILHHDGEQGIQRVLEELGETRGL